MLEETIPLVKAWDTKVSIEPANTLMAALRSAGLPLAYEGESMSEDEDGNESENSSIVCLASVCDSNVQAVIATPSGLAYRVESEMLDADFWAFAAKYYYVVTGNMADRKKMAELSNVHFKVIKGRCLSRNKTDILSSLSIDQLLNEIGYSAAAQANLFD